MESGPAVFAGAVFALFGAGLLLWAGAQSRLRTPGAHGVSARAFILHALPGVISLVAAAWCLLDS